MNAETGIALLLTLISACALNYGYLLEHRAASSLPRLSLRRPLRSLRSLLSAKTWLFGFGCEAAGWVLFVVALVLAPLALVQASAAGGIGILALLIARLSDCRLDGREWLGVAIAIGGLAVLGISLAGGAEEGAGASLVAIGLWLACSVVAAGLIVRSAGLLLPSAPSFGIATGILFACGDITTKAAVSGGARLGLLAAVIAFYAAGTVLLQMGFQRGGALATAGVATLLTNALPIAAATTIFHEPIPDGALGALRVLAFAAVVAGAVLLAPLVKRDEAPDATGPAAPQPA